MKILITGGAGYIGSHTIIDILENTNWDVISIDNYSTSTETTYQRIEKITGKTIMFYNVDLKDIDATKKVFEENKDIKGIIHFAAHKWVGDSVENPLKYYNNNLIGLTNILTLQKEFNIKSLIFSSSCSVYGNIDTLPVTEKTQLNKAESPYAYTKQVGERIIEDFIYANNQLKAISLRYFNPVGAHISGLNGEIQPIPNNLIPFVTQTAIGKIKQLNVFGNNYNTKDGTCVRDYIHVSDIASAHVAALKTLFENANFPNYDVINLGSGNGVSVLEIINAFEQQNNIKLNYKFGPRRQGDVESIYSDSSKALKVLGWKTNYNINDMVKSAWLWEQNLNKEK
ncbi:MAG: UDP-glucose 4-epimerase GalE [Flavobacteriales bacterium]|nr:UDP-glucose 4-epimerase GalE [Flavobacteriales bacterium]MCB9172998.1 UDP-glucose 4-epimerase GalE [Flavobacteriales bacterium]